MMTLSSDSSASFLSRCSRIVAADRVGVEDMVYVVVCTEQCSKYEDRLDIPKQWIKPLWEWKHPITSLVKAQLAPDIYHIFSKNFWLLFNFVRKAQKSNRLNYCLWFALTFTISWNTSEKTILSFVKPCNGKYAKIMISRCCP